MFKNLVPVFQKFPEVEIKINPIQNRKQVLDKEKGTKTCIFSNNEDVTGEVSISLKEESRFEHLGITIELIGKITTKNNDHDSEFLNLSKELEAPGSIEKSTKYNFIFKKKINMPYESYKGENVELKYFIRVTITKKYISTKSHTEKAFFVYNPIVRAPRLNASLNLDIGIQDKLDFSFEIFQNKFHLNDCIVGRLIFNKVDNIQIKSAELHFFKKEIFMGEKENNEIILISKFEIIDGQPYEKETIPIRIFIGSFELNPTYRDVNNFFAVKYFLKILILDNDDRAYTKDQEIVLFRNFY